MKKDKIQIQGQPVRVEIRENGEYVCITDIAKTAGENYHDIVRNYFRNGSNISFLKIWEEIKNTENFDANAAQEIINSSVKNSFTLSVKEWINSTNAIGIEAVVGRYGGTYAHKDIAIHFSTWLSPEAYMYMILEFQRLKSAETKHLKTIENTKNWIFEKVMRNAEELNTIARLGLDMQKLGEEE